ncbi:response regulator transcription factor [Sulfuricurvum sp.]|uniref:response regulator transcription factor n=1 Tax=Sulfuricurvum sp. TaxID=2025608 RepID=UPI00261EED71|nr:response regulator transcription factor [Sulfuricurvum sp.]MDD2781242.1 response regulator transcription factor [Sulfuricurvum sp.]
MYILNSDKTILIVEDDIESNNNISYLLKSKFAEVISAYDGMEGWKKYQEKNPDIILTDIEMPKMDGLALIRRIRADNETIPIVILSSYSHSHYLLDAIPLKLEEYLLKPITMSKLNGLLQNLERKGKDNMSHSIDIDENIRYDFQSKSIFQNGTVLRLSHLEISLMELLLKRRGYIVSYEEIEYALYGTQEVSRNALKIVVSNLRKKIIGLQIQATPKLGYRLS